MGINRKLKKDKKINHLEKLTTIIFEMQVEEQLPAIVARHVHIPERIVRQLGGSEKGAMTSVSLLAGKEELEYVVAAYKDGIKALEERISQMQMTN